MPDRPNTPLLDRVTLPSGLKALSDRELQVFLRLARGETIGHLALSLSLSVKTVSTCRSRVMEKMGAHSLAELVQHVVALEPASAVR